MIDFEKISLIFALLSFGVNIITQMTKEFISLPTKLWTMIVSSSLCLICYFAGIVQKILPFGIGGVTSTLVASFFVSYCAMYGFDTLKELFKRFKGGENINDNN